MYRHSADGIVHMEADIQILHSQNHKNAGHKADQRSADRVHAGAACRDSDQTGQRSIQTHGDVGLSILLPCKQHTGYRCNRRRDGRGAEDPCHLVHVCRRGAVEAIPGEPQDKASEGPQGHRMSRNGV